MFRTASTCFGVRQFGPSAPAHCSVPGSKRQRMGSLTRPSLAPSSASQAAIGAILQQLQLLLRQVRLWRACDDAVPDLAGHLMRPVVRGVAGEDAVEVGRVALRLHEPLFAAGRASAVVGVLGRLAVVGLQDRLGDRPSSGAGRDSCSRSSVRDPAATWAIRPLCGRCRCWRWRSRRAAPRPLPDS